MNKEGFYTTDNCLGYNHRYFSVQFIIQWIEFIKRHEFKWCNFSLITCQFEYEKVGPQLEIELGLIGFYCRIAFALPWDTPESEHLRGLMKEIEEGGEDMWDLSIPMKELGRIRRGESISWEFDHKGESYIVTKKLAESNPVH